MARNNFHKVGVLRQSGPEREALGPANLAGGVRLDASAIEIPLNSAVDLKNVRFEEQGIRRDFGYTRIGSPASSRVLGLGEHKFIDAGQLFHRLVRVVRNSSTNPTIEVLVGTSWTNVDTASESINNVLLSTVSTQGKFLMADGDKILSWGEVPVTGLTSHNFPAGNSLSQVNDETVVSVDSADAIGDLYTLNYSVDITGAAAEDKIVTLGFYHEGEQVTTASYTSPASSAADSWPEESVDLQLPTLTDFDELSIKIEEAEVTNDTVQDPFSSGSTQDNEAEKSVSGEGVGDQYSWQFQLTIRLAPTTGTPPLASGMTIGFYVRKSGTWTKIDEKEYINADQSDIRIVDVDESYVVDGMTGSDAFGYTVESVRGNGGFISDRGVVEYQRGVLIDVHGFNQPSDGDPSPGEQHEERTGTTSSFGLLATDAPAALYIFAFGDRLIALQDDGDPQKISWSADGDITEWSDLDSGSTSLLDARSDPLDELMAMGSVASNVAVLLRQRSMMRVQETGNPLLAISVTHWIEGIGTESPHSVAQVEDGIMFLSHDLMVYYFNGAGKPVPVGSPIHRDLIEEISEDDLRDVDSTYDPVFGEYWMNIPGKVWIFSLGEFLENQELKWRSRDLKVDRLATVSRLG